jgi:hypothetical protein
MNLVNCAKLCINWHWPILVWAWRRYPTLTAVGVGPLEIVWPRRGYELLTGRQG